MRKNSSRYVIFQKLQPLMLRRDGKAKELGTMSFHQLSSILPLEDIFHNAVYLGTEPGLVDWFALSLTKDIDESTINKVFSDDVMIGNAFFSLMSMNEMQSSVASQARGLLAWHSSHQFCTQCGSRSMMVEGGYRRQCTNDKCKTRKGEPFV